jgi:hypothetical protein
MATPYVPAKVRIKASKANADALSETGSGAKTGKLVPEYKMPVPTPITT